MLQVEVEDVYASITNLLATEAGAEPAAAFRMEGGAFFQPIATKQIQAVRAAARLRFLVQLVTGLAPARSTPQDETPQRPPPFSYCSPLAREILRVQPLGSTETLAEAISRDTQLRAVDDTPPFLSAGLYEEETDKTLVQIIRAAQRQGRCVLLGCELTGDIFDLAQNETGGRRERGPFYLLTLSGQLLSVRWNVPAARTTYFFSLDLDDPARWVNDNFSSIAKEVNLQWSKWSNGTLGQRGLGDSAKRSRNRFTLETSNTKLITLKKPGPNVIVSSDPDGIYVSILPLAMGDLARYVYHSDGTSWEMRRMERKTLETLIQGLSTWTGTEPPATLNDAPNEITLNVTRMDQLFS
jgi:hypothetical protein